MNHAISTQQVFALAAFALALGCSSPALEGSGASTASPQTLQGVPVIESPQPAWWDWGASACPEGAKLAGTAPPNGRLVECVRPNGVVHGLSTLWYPNGHEGTTTEYRDGIRQGRWMYWLHGRKLIEGGFKDGRRDGVWTYWFDQATELDADARLDRTYDAKNYVVETYNHGLLVSTVRFRDGKPAP